MKDLAREIVTIAKREVGTRETGGNNRGAALQKYFDADNYDLNGSKPGDEGYPWCAAFVCWVIKEALAAVGAKETATFKRPRTASAWGFENWSLDQDSTTWTKKPHGGDIQPGDIVVFRSSHVGIAVSSPDDNGLVRTVEGNTDEAGSREGGGVFLKARPMHKLRSRIRFRQDKLKY